MIAAVFFAMIAHVGFAANDLTGVVGSRRFSGSRMSLYSWICGCFLALGAAPFLFRNPLDFWPVVAVAGLALIMAVAYPVFLYTLEHGNATINGVIAGTFPLWVVIFSLLFFGETLSARQSLAISVIFIGVALSTLHLSRRTRWHNMFNRYSLIAFGVSVVWGIYFTFVRYPVERLGWFEANFVSQFFSTAYSFILLVPIIRRSKSPKFEYAHLRWPVLNAISGFSGSLAFNYALTLGNSSVIAPIAGSYPGLFAFACYVFFREKLNKLQVVGLLLTLAGVVALSLASV